MLQNSRILTKRLLVEDRGLLRDNVAATRGASDSRVLTGEQEKDRGLHIIGAYATHEDRPSISGLRDVRLSVRLPIACALA